MRGGLVLSLGVAMLSGCGQSEESKQREAIADALSKCQNEILSLAKYGDAERPPYVNPEVASSAILFEWPKGKFYFTNGFGAKVPQAAECIVARGVVTFLKLNEQIVIDK